MPTRPVTVLAHPGVQSLDVIGPFEVFAGASRAAAAYGIDAGYAVSVVAAEPGPVTTESGIVRVATALPGSTPRLDALLIPGVQGVETASQDRGLVEWVHCAAGCSQRIATVCSGALPAAEAGPLDGRRVTTHWARAEQLAIEYPDIKVDADPIYLLDGNVLSSDRVSTGIDLALALVEDDVGTDVLQLIARWLVMFLHRPGGQTQFATPVWVRRAERVPVREAQARVEAAPAGDHRVAVLAASASLSERHFTRLFTFEVGKTPAGSSNASAPGLHVVSSSRPSTRSMSSPPGADSAAPKPSGAPSIDDCEQVPMPTGAGSPPTPPPRLPIGPLHDGSDYGRHPPFRRVYRPRRHRALRGPPAHTEHRRGLRRTPAG